MTTPLKVSIQYWATECRRDIDGVLALYHDDATYEDALGARHGTAAIRAVYEESARAYPGLEVSVGRTFTSGDEAAIEFDAVLIDPSGRRFRIRGVNLVRLRDGRFESVRSYEDRPVVDEPAGGAA